MSEQDASQKRSNIRLAVALGAVALILSMWPLYILRQGLGG
jgi:hypothetical protein